jgi:transposase
MLDKQTRGAILLLRSRGHSLRCISRLLSLSRDSVRKVVRVGSDDPPIIVRPSKLDAYRGRIVQMLAEFDGNVVKVHRALAEGGTSVRYPTLTAFCRNNRLLDSTCDPRHSIVAARQWLLELVNGAHSVERFQSQFPHAADLRFLFSQLRHGRSRQRKKAATILARKRGISNSVIAATLRSSRSTTRRYYKMYLQAGPEKLFAWNTTRHTGAEQQLSNRTKTQRILETLHHKPTAFGINRTNWTQPTLLKAYEQSYGEIISRSTLARILRRAGYRWRKARRVLTSSDPSYREKVELLKNTLRCLGENEMFFFLDEWGPIQVRKRGGKSYRNDQATIPRHQISRGTVSLIAALSATTNQVTWRFLESKDSHAMMDMIEILYNQYHTKTKLYVTWDAVAWHNSGPFLEALDHFNEETRSLSIGPIIELVPLPISSQFLNAVEGVLSGMTRAVINNSDYPDAAQMKQAISKHFSERNEHFKHNPKRVGKIIWDVDFFRDFAELGAGNHEDS